MFKISASIFSSNNIEIDLNHLSELGVDFLHVDWNTKKDIRNEVKRISDYSDIPLDFHIIGDLDEPDFVSSLNTYSCCIQYRDSVFEEDLRRLSMLRSDIKKGFAVCLGDPTDKISKSASEIDYLMIMNTVPGVSGQKLDLDESLRYIELIRLRFPNMPLYVDGGVNASNVYAFFNHNITTFICGSYLMKGDSILKSYANIIKSEEYLNKKIGEIAIERPLMTCDYNLNLVEILKALDKSGCGFLALCENEEIKGVVTDGDVRRALIKNLNIKKEDIINENFLKFDYNDSVSMAINNMSNHKSFVKMIPVKGNVVSFVSANSIIRRY